MIALKSNLSPTISHDLYSVLHELTASIPPLSNNVKPNPPREEPFSSCSNQVPTISFSAEWRFLSPPKSSNTKATTTKAMPKPIHKPVLLPDLSFEVSSLLFGLDDSVCEICVSTSFSSTGETGAFSAEEPFCSLIEGVLDGASKGRKAGRSLGSFSKKSIPYPWHSR